MKDRGGRRGPGVGNDIGGLMEKVDLKVGKFNIRGKGEIRSNIKELRELGRRSEIKSLE